MLANPGSLVAKLRKERGIAPPYLPIVPLTTTGNGAGAVGSPFPILETPPVKIDQGVGVDAQFVGQLILELVQVEPTGQAPETWSHAAIFAVFATLAIVGHSYHPRV